MRESTLLKLCILWSLFAILGLFFISEFNTAKVPNSSIENYYGEEIVINGTIIKQTAKPEVTFITLDTEYEEVLVVLFDKSEFNGSQLRVQGKVDIYRGRFEVIANKIWCVDC